MEDGQSSYFADGQSDAVFGARCGKPDAESVKAGVGGPYAKKFVAAANCVHLIVKWGKQVL